MLSQERLRELFVYENGQLIWTDAGPKRVRNKRAGTVNGQGYRQVGIDGVIYPEHRLIFMYHHGFVPKLIDHINCVRADNRIENLRPCDQRHNNYNTAGWSKRSLPKGVTWSKKDKRYQAQLSIGGRNKYLGQFKELADAEHCVRKAREAAHGEFARQHSWEVCNAGST